MEEIINTTNSADRQDSQVSYWNVFLACVCCPKYIMLTQPSHFFHKNSRQMQLFCAL